jgi:hypothetical protein
MTNFVVEREVLGLAMWTVTCLCRLWRGACPPLLGGVNDDLTTKAMPRKLGGCGDVKGGVRWPRGWLGGGGRRDATRLACAWRVAPASGPASVMHMSTSARHMDRQSLACLGVRVR